MRGWKMHLKTDKGLDYLSGVFNPKLRGWIHYYGKFRISALRGLCTMFQNILVKWAMKKFKRRSWQRAREFMDRIARTKPTLFAHWELGMCR